MIEGERVKKNILRASQTKQHQIPAEALARYQANIKKTHQNIERKYQHSTTNKLYLFPRTCSQFSPDTSDISSESSISSNYQLKAQNQKNHKGQTNYIPHKPISLTKSQESVGSGTHPLPQKKKIEISFDTKKKTPHKGKSKYNSNQLLVEQYSLEGRQHGSVKKGSHRGMVISFRGTKPDVNISMSGKRIQTQIY